MFNTFKFKIFSLRHLPVFSGLLFVGVLVLLPISAGAQCSGNWNANGHMTLRQAGSKATEIWLSHKGNGIQGTALAIVRNGGSNDGERRMTGTIDGSFDGDSFSVQIYWDNGQTGVYNGKVLPSGRLDGEAWEKRSPNVRIPWHTDEGLNCVVLVKTPPPPPPKPIKSSGKAKPAPTPAPPPTPPFLVATPAIFPTPFVQTGFVILTWDAGPDHPDAEIWLKTPMEL